MNFTNKVLVSGQAALPVGREPDRFVVHVFMHNHRGAVGALLNGHQISALKHVFLKDVFNTPEGYFPLLKQMMLDKELDSIPLHYAGPSKTEGIYFLHGHEEIKGLTGKDDESTDNPNNPSGSELIDGVYFGSPFTFGHLVERGLLRQKKFRFLMGQFKWYASQLETEIDAGYWEVVDPDPEFFFDASKCESLLPSRKKALSQVNPSSN